MAVLFRDIHNDPFWIGGIPLRTPLAVVIECGVVNDEFEPLAAVIDRPMTQTELGGNESRRQVTEIPDVRGGIESVEVVAIDASRESSGLHGCRAFVRGRELDRWHGRAAIIDDGGKSHSALRQGRRVIS